MGLMRRLRGGNDDKSTGGSAMGTALAEIGALFRPTRHKQTEHVMESRRRRGDVPSAGDFDPDSGTLILRRPAEAAEKDAEDPDEGAPGPQ